MIHEIHVEYIENLMSQQTVWNMDMLQEVWKNGDIRRVGNDKKNSIVESWIKLTLVKILFYKRKSTWGWFWSRFSRRLGID